MPKVVIIIASQHETICEAVPKMCTNHRFVSSKAHVMGRRCVLHLVTFLWYLPKRTECAVVYPANLKQSCVGGSRIADISESSMPCLPAAGMQLKSRLSVSGQTALPVYAADRQRETS